MRLVLYYVLISHALQFCVRALLVSLSEDYPRKVSYTRGEDSFAALVALVWAIYSALLIFGVIQ